MGLRGTSRQAHSLRDAPLQLIVIRHLSPVFCVSIRLCISHDKTSLHPLVFLDYRSKGTTSRERDEIVVASGTLFGTLGTLCGTLWPWTGKFSITFPPLSNRLRFDFGHRCVPCMFLWKGITLQLHYKLSARISRAEKSMWKIPYLVLDIIISNTK